MKDIQADFEVVHLPDTNGNGRFGRAELEEYNLRKYLSSRTRDRKDYDNRNDCSCQDSERCSCD